MLQPADSRNPGDIGRCIRSTLTQTGCHQFPLCQPIPFGLLFQPHPLPGFSLRSLFFPLGFIDRIDLRHTLGGVPAAADTGYRPIRMDHNATWFIAQPLCSELRL